VRPLQNFLETALSIYNLRI